MPGGVLDVVRVLWRPDLILAIQRVFGPAWDLVFEALSLLGGAQITLVAVAWARWFHGRRLAGRLLLALFLGIAVDLLIWNLYPTPRPDDPRLRIASQIPIASFPSGHLVTVLTLWGTFAAARVVPWFAVVAIAILVGLGRLALGQHYPGDILGGVLVGALLMAIVAWVWPHLLATLARQPWPRLAVAGAAVSAVALAAATIVPPTRWTLLGVLAGVAVGLPLEARLVGFAPATPGSGVWGWRLRLALLGVAGLAPVLLGALLLGRFAPIRDLLLPVLAALWILLGAPATFRRLGWPRAGE